MFGCKAWIQDEGLFHLAFSHDLSPVSFTFSDFRRKSEVSRLYLVLLSEGLLSDLLEDTQLANGRSRIRQRPLPVPPPLQGFPFPPKPPNTSLGPGPFAVAPWSAGAAPECRGRLAGVIQKQSGPGGGHLQRRCFQNFSVSSSNSQRRSLPPHLHVLLTGQ